MPAKETSSTYGCSYIHTIRSGAGVWLASRAAVVAAFRRGTVLPAEQELGRWYQALADAIESGDAVRTGYCALYAMNELNSLMGCYIRPLARIGKKKLEADKRRGRRTRNSTKRATRHVGQN